MDVDRKPGLVGELLQSEFPEPQGLLFVPGSPARGFEWSGDPAMKIRRRRIWHALRRSTVSASVGSRKVDFTNALCDERFDLLIE